MEVNKLPKLESNAIDSFSGDEYYSEPLLEYVKEVGDEIHPEIDLDSRELIPQEDGTLKAGKPIMTLPSRSPNIFGFRYHEGFFDDARLPEYEDDRNLGKSLKSYGLDASKFWYLCLYLKDYALDKTKLIAENSPKEDLEDLLSAIYENIEFSFPCQHSKEVVDILNSYTPTYTEGEDGTLNEVVPEEVKKAREAYAEAQNSWKPEYQPFTNYTKDKEEVKAGLALFLSHHLFKMENKATLTFKVGRKHSLEINNPTTLIALAYLIEKGWNDVANITSMNSGSFNPEQLKRMKLCPEEFGGNEENPEVPLSYALFLFSKYLTDFLKKQTIKKIPNVSTSRDLIISKMAYYTGLSDKEKYAEDFIEKKGKYVANTLLKDDIKKVSERKVSKLRNSIYWT